MYIKASLILKYYPIAKSTLFKLIHEQRVRSMVMNIRDYVFWTDFKQYLEDKILGDLETILTTEIREDHPSDIRCVTLSHTMRVYHINQRKWKRKFVQFFKDHQVIPDSQGCSPVNEIHKAFAMFREDTLQKIDSIRNTIALWQKYPTRKLNFKNS